MSEEDRDNKAKKLASARKKLKEYQQRTQAIAANSGSIITSATTTLSESLTSGSGQGSSNMSENSEPEMLTFLNNINSNNTGYVATTVKKEETTKLISDLMKNTSSDNAEDGYGEATESIIYMNIDQQQQNLTPSSYAVNNNQEANVEENLTTKNSEQNLINYVDQSSMNNANAIQILINEKIQLTNELNRYRADCHSKTMALEELRESHTKTLSRMEELQYAQSDQQQRLDRQYDNVEKLQKELTSLSAQQNENVLHLRELSGQLISKDHEIQQLTNILNEKNKKLELSELRIKQLTVENNPDSEIRSDDKVNQIETLTQTKFMYEQQIRDLQAMLQQSNSEKEQSNAQYLSYVQQLNKQVNQLNERNAVLQADNQKLQEHEQQLMKHIQGLEKDIQKNLSKQQEFNQNTLLETQRRELLLLREQITDHELERHEFQLKIKSQENRLEELKQLLEQKQIDFDEMKQKMDQFLLEKPDNVKLLATMESDKVAASRALTQNAELKKQLDELEKSFVQLTNSKAELMNLLDAEKYANREINSNYALLEERVQSIDERFRNKDNEMIRLSHENEKLIEINGKLKNEIKRLEEEITKNQCEESTFADEKKIINNDDNSVTIESCTTELAASNQSAHNYVHMDDEKGNQNVYTKMDNVDKMKDNDVSTVSNERLIMNGSTQDYSQDLSVPPTIATTEAVEKLQERFNQLMGQVAELTDEKQRLEHLVLQLQGETETIGEYIALYQKQRRMLKQREYEKAAQMQLLQDERKLLQHRLIMLNNLVCSLGLQQQEQEQSDFSSNETTEHIPKGDSASQKDSLAIREESDPNLINNNCKSSPTKDDFILDTTPKVSNSSLNLNNNDSESRQEILTKIHQIISDIDENSNKLSSVMPQQPYNSADHLPCCSGKFEVV